MIDWTREIRQKNGLPAKLIATLERPAFAGYPRVVLITTSINTEGAVHYSNEGMCGVCPRLDDLENVPEPPQTQWVNLFADPTITAKAYSTKSEADAGTNYKRIACVPVTFRPGDGL